MMYLYLIILSLTETGADRHPFKLSSNKSAIFPHAHASSSYSATPFSLHRCNKHPYTKRNETC